MPRMDRRTFLGTLPAVGALPALGWTERLLAQAGAPPIRVTGLSQMTLTVSDIKRSVEFYQALFGMPVQARQGSTVLLRIGTGPKFLALRPAGAGERPSISAFGMAVENLEINRIIQMINAQGGKATASGPTVWVTDPGGISIQLHAPTYCGGSGKFGEVCGVPQASSTKWLFAGRDLSHFTIGVAV